MKPVCVTSSLVYVGCNAGVQPKHGVGPSRQAPSLGFFHWMTWGSGERKSRLVTFLTGENTPFARASWGEAEPRKSPFPDKDTEWFDDKPRVTAGGDEPGQDAGLIAKSHKLLCCQSVPEVTDRFSTGGASPPAPFPPVAAYRPHEEQLTSPVLHSLWSGVPSIHSLMPWGLLSLLAGPSASNSRAHL